MAPEQRQQPEQQQQRCWACGSCNPVPHGDPQTLFRCSWCAALFIPAGKGQAEPTPDPAAPRLQLDEPRRCKRPLGPLAAGCTLITFVLALVGSVFVLGATIVQPALFGPMSLAVLHFPTAVLLVFNILFNYAACIRRSAGPVQPHLRRTALDNAGRVQRGALDGCRFCPHCFYYKPPAAHHCSSCACCVMDLDHHCLYLSSCVGAANLRHFLVFLAFLVAGAAYGLSLGLLLGWRDRAVLWRHTRRVVQGTSHQHWLRRTLGFSLTWLLWAPQWVACWAYFTFVCWVTLVATGLLLARQVRLLLRGESYLSSLSRARTLPAAQAAAHHDAAAAPAGLARVRHVFGPRHPLTWVLPAWDVATEPASRHAKLV